MGTHPREDSSASLPWLRTENGAHIFTWQRSKTAAGALTPEMSSNMTTRATVTAPPVLVSETPQTQTWAVTLTPDDARRFLRVKFVP